MSRKLSELSTRASTIPRSIAIAPVRLGSPHSISLAHPCAPDRAAKQAYTAWDMPATRNDASDDASARSASSGSRNELSAPLLTTTTIGRSGLLNQSIKSSSDRVHAMSMSASGSTWTMMEARPSSWCVAEALTRAWWNRLAVVTLFSTMDTTSPSWSMIKVWLSARLKEEGGGGLVSPLVAALCANANLTHRSAASVWDCTICDAFVAPQRLPGAEEAVVAAVAAAAAAAPLMFSATERANSVASTTEP